WKLVFFSNFNFCVEKKSLCAERFEIYVQSTLINPAKLILLNFVGISDFPRYHYNKNKTSLILINEKILIVKQNIYKTVAPTYFLFKFFRI
ncbi:hypothetical protein BpHYR1_039104, partial [Brachionus plicatilis]